MDTQGGMELTRASFHMERMTEAFRWTDQDEDFFALFVRADEIIAEDGLIVRVFKDFSLLLSELLSPTMD